MADNAAEKTANSFNIYEQLDASKKEIRICHVEGTLDQEGRVRCRLEIVSLEPARSLKSLENGDLHLPSAMQRPDVQDDGTETGASGTADTAISKDAREVEGDQDGHDPVQSNGRSYEAISWTWGDFSKKAQIVLNGQLVDVSHNAEVLLRRLCFEQQHTTVWLDAICINQTDLAERSQQVAIMRHVYTNATKVLVWLGEDKEGIAERAFSSIDKLISQCMFAKSGSTSLHDMFFDGASMKYSPEFLPFCDWQALSVLFSYPWFSRLWVVQEVILGASPRCYCGIHSHDWHEISLAAQWLDHRVYHRKVYADRMIRGIDLAARLWRLSHLGPQISDLLRLSVHLDCSEPLDKVYGMLGIMQQRSSRESPINMIPDYKSNLAIVYAQITKTAIASHPKPSNALSVLCTAQAQVPRTDDQHNELSTAWPSWVPKYHWRESIPDGTPQYLNCRGHAAPGIHWFANHLGQDVADVLTLQGIVVERIKTCTEPYTEATWTNDFLRYQWISHCGHVASNLGHDTCAIALTLTCERTWDSRDALRIASRHAALYENFVTSCEGKTFADLPPGPRHYVQGVYAWSANRVFFTTPARGIGMGPPGMRTNDLLCILFGGPRIYVLRQQDEHYVLIGTAYMHGIMQGQYVQYLGKARFEKEVRWFEIH